MGAAHADIVPQIGPSDVTLQLDGNYKWSYEGQLNPAQKVLSGDFFTIYDFAGFVPGTTLQPADWSFSWSNTGVTPTGLLPLINIPGGITDNPGIPNLTWTYTGSGTIAGPADLGAFSAESVYGDNTISPFAAEATEQSGFTAGSKVDNFGWIGDAGAGDAGAVHAGTAGPGRRPARPAPPPQGLTRGLQLAELKVRGISAPHLFCVRSLALLFPRTVFPPHWHHSCLIQNRIAGSPLANSKAGKSASGSEFRSCGTLLAEDDVDAVLLGALVRFTQR